MRNKKLLAAGLACVLACVPMFAGCEQKAEDFMILALHGFQKAPEPSVKEGRFNFSVTYEVGGEEKTISSVYVCKYVESTLWLDGWGITWESYIEDTEIATLPPENNENLIIVETNDDGTIYLDLKLNPGYFMSQPGEGHRKSEPYMYIDYKESVWEEKGTYGSEDLEVLATYGVQIISYEYDAPIENSYD